MRIAALFTLAVIACAQSIQAPRIGTMIDRNGDLRTVYGIAGSFTLGEAVAGEPVEQPIATVERRNGRVFIVGENGGVVDALPEDADGPVLPLREGIVYVSGGELVFLRADRSQVRHTLGGVIALRRMGPDYVQAGGHALRLSTGELYRLPDAPPQGRRR